MKISVIVPVYNGEELLNQCLDSVFNQSLSPYEVIVVDDGSKDDTRLIAEDYDILYYHQINQGPGAAKNKGLHLATGDYICFLDHDDLWSKHKLEIQLKELLLNSEKIVIGKTCMTNLTGIQFGEIRYFSALGSMMIDKDVFDTIGIFDTHLSTGEDFDWFKRCYEIYRVTYIDELVLYYRRHEKNLTNDFQLNKQFMLSFIRSNLNKIKQKRG